MDKRGRLRVRLQDAVAAMNKLIRMLLARAVRSVRRFRGHCVDCGQTVYHGQLRCPECRPYACRNWR